MIVSWKPAIASALLLCLSLPLSAQETADSPIALDAELRIVKDGFTFTEGPVADQQGNLYFTDIPNNRIHKLNLDGELSVVRENTNRANGLAFDDKGRLIACEGGAKRVTAMEADGSITVLADSYDGKPLNSPNDLWIDDEGGIYFTDPNYGDAGNLTQNGEHVYYLPPDGGALRRVVSDMGKPNGIIGTADNKRMYIADTALQKVFVFEIKEDASLGPKEDFINSGSDGVTLDESGNLYITWRDGVGIYNPKGERIDLIEVSPMPTNVAFAGKDHQTLYITARPSVYAIDMRVKGQR